MLLFWWQLLLSAFLLLACSNHVVSSVSGAKILVFSPTLSRSHMISNARVADVLARDGHNVTLLEVEYNVPVKAMNASKAARTVHVSGQFMPQTIDGMNRQEVLVRRLFETTSLRKAFFFTKIFQITLNEACEEFISTQSRLLVQLMAESFDMLIAEQLNFCGAGLAHLLRIPTFIQLSSCSPQEHVASLMGLPNPSSYLPSLLGPVSTESWPLVNRLNNFAYQLAASFAYFHYGIDPLTGIFRQKFGSNFTDLRDIVKDSPLVLINVDELVDFPRPMFPNFVYIGGLGMEESEERHSSLQEPFLSQMAKGAHGIVFFSMGSVVRSTGMTESFRRHLFQAFAQITDYHFIVKIEKEDHFSAGLAEGLDNVFISAWVPQSDMLFHPRLKLFITHGGYNSLMEAARAGVPLITMGFFADQYRNGRLAERNGWALPFDKQLLCEGSEQFRTAIRRVLEDPGYKKSAKRTQRLIRTKPFSAEERLTKSIRFLGLNGGKLPELLSESRNLNAIEFYNLDLIFLFALGAIIFLAVSIFSVSYVGRNFIKHHHIDK